jgi:hypothetical protein
MQLNGTPVVDRHNRPTVIQKVALRAFFINDGEYYDPADISGVTVFEKTSNESPSSVLSGNIVSPAVLSSNIVMQFGASANRDGAALYTSSYDPTVGMATSSIYRISQGQYMCVLDGTQSTSGQYTFHGSAVNIENKASAVNDYIDAWTVKFNSGSDYQTLLNYFHLYNDTFFTSTEPLILTAENRLKNKHLALSSIENLKVTTDVTVANRGLSPDVKNIFKESCITSATIKIDKINEGSVTLPAHVEVSGFAETASTVQVSPDNTILWRFDTTQLATHPRVAEFGGLTGTYRATVKYGLLTETIISPPFYFTIS